MQEVYGKIRSQRIWYDESGPARQTLWMCHTNLPGPADVTLLTQTIGWEISDAAPRTLLTAFFKGAAGFMFEDLCSRPETAETAKPRNPKTLLLHDATIMAGKDAGHFILYRYEPSMAAAVVFIILFLVATALHTYQLVRTKTWFFIPFVIGGFFEWIGYTGRAISAAEEGPDYSLGPFIIQSLLLLLAPALYAASIYMILGRVIALTEGEQYSLVPRKWLTKLFVVGDVVSFIVQGAGGAIMAGGGLASLHKGERLVVGGLVVQVIFFAFFAITAGLFHWRLAQLPTRKVLSLDVPWQKYLFVLYIVSFLVIFRSLFRLVEYIQGNDGYLISHEIYLYVFDGVLMWLSMVVFAWEHPSEINTQLHHHGTAVRKFIDFYHTI
ncbi:hypothetical protein FSARC_13794 [Fusarium sarcochroum]|uniref:Uncharacterized protein n=1 Tax=Fusarium sarcochroum TaxID=1208366 RepID=A0A8H4SYV6_9HYPO|nr:hypothetical protein FSARC_13794 [Fusarium sarcochroum]